MADRELWSSRRDDGPTLLTDNLTVGTPFGDYVPVTYVHSRRRGRAPLRDTPGPIRLPGPARRERLPVATPWVARSRSARTRQLGMRLMVLADRAEGDVT